jgi:group I intron endonuclease
MQVSGVYEIVNKINGKTYIGSSFDTQDRWRRHKRLLVRNKHHNYHLQKSWNKYGSQCFKFVLAESVSKDQLLEIEQQYLDVCKLLPFFYYNTCYVAGSPMKGRIPWNKGTVGLQIAWNKGISFSKETRQKMSESAKKKIGDKNSMFGKRQSEAAREKMRLAWRIRYPVSDETKQKMSASHRK